MLFFFGALPIDQLNIKHPKKLKEIPSKHFLENLPEKASMYAFIHMKLIDNLQGFCQYILANMLNLKVSQYTWYMVHFCYLTRPQKSSWATNYSLSDASSRQGGISCTGARVAPAKKFGLGRKF